MAAGFLYPPGDYQTAVALTKQLVRDRALRERVGGAARLEVRPPVRSRCVAHILNGSLQLPVSSIVPAPRSEESHAVGSPS